MRKPILHEYDIICAKLSKKVFMVKKYVEKVTKIGSMSLFDFDRTILINIVAVDTYVLMNHVDIRLYFIVATSNCGKKKHF